ncbi:MAG: HAD-IA family hydrolase [Nitrospirota bacterium]
MHSKKNVFFDAAGTLFFVNRGVGFHYSKIAAKYGVVADPDLLDKRFHEAFQKSVPLSTPHISQAEREKAEEAWWNDLVRDVFKDIPFPAFDLFFKALYLFFQQGVGEADGSWALFPETKEVLERLVSLGHPIGLISNFDSRIHSVLESLGIRGIFETITYSSEAGFSKPSPFIFQQALRKANCEPGHAIHVGDHPVYDIEGAQSAGIKAILIDRSAKQKQKINVITNLREIYEYL